MRVPAMFLLIPMTLLVSSATASAARHPARERSAKKACLAGDTAKGVEILAGLYVDTNDITFIFNQGRCFEQNRRYDDAIGRFREYLLKGEAQLSPEDKALAEKHIQLCESYLPKPEPKLEPKPEPKPEIRPEPKPLLSPTLPPEFVAPARPVAVAPASSAGELARSPEASGNRPGASLRATGIAVGALGVAGLVTGVVLNLKVNSMSVDLEKPDNFNRDTDDSRKTYKTLGWVAYGGGAACLIGGTLLYYLGLRSRGDSRGSVVVAPTVGPGGVEIALAGGF
jgi:hypothetical protein